MGPRRHRRRAGGRRRSMLHAAAVAAHLVGGPHPCWQSTPGWPGRWCPSRQSRPWTQRQQQQGASRVSGGAAAHARRGTQHKHCCEPSRAASRGLACRRSACGAAPAPRGTARRPQWGCRGGAPCVAGRASQTVMSIQGTRRPCRGQSHETMSELTPSGLARAPQQPPQSPPAWPPARGRAAPARRRPAAGMARW